MMAEWQIQALLSFRSRPWEAQRSLSRRPQAYLKKMPISVSALLRKMAAEFMRKVRKYALTS